MTKSRAKDLRQIDVSTDVFAAIWKSHQPGETTEDEILRRLIGLVCGADKSKPIPPPGDGIWDPRSRVHFPRGFTVFRTYKGTHYEAQVSCGAWLLDPGQYTAKSLNGLAKFLGISSENVWVNWYFVDEDGQRKHIDSLRESDTPRETPLTAPGAGDADSEEFVEVGDDVGEQSEEKDQEKVTWRDDVLEALTQLGGEAHLSSIYERVERIRRSSCRTIPPSLDATVRRTLEDHSSDSKNFRGQDLFGMPRGQGHGFWAIRAPSKRK